LLSEISKIEALKKQVGFINYHREGFNIEIKRRIEFSDVGIPKEL
jgi:hypothetical protein